MPDLPLSEKDLAAIQARVDAATPGEWDAEPHAHGASGCRCLSCDEDPTGWYVETPKSLCCDDVVANLMTEENGWEPKNSFGRPLSSCGQGPFLSFEDADFAAHAREDVPRLLATIQGLQKQVADVAEERDWFKSGLVPKAFRRRREA